MSSLSAGSSPAALLKTFLQPLRPIRRAVQLWIDADGLRMSAAMSFYGILSLAPLLVLLVAVLGWWLDRSYIEASLVQQIADVIGTQGAQLVQQALASAQEPSDGLLASVIAFGLLLSGATGVFAELQDAFERLWRRDTGELPRQKWWYSASLRLRGIAYILAFGFLLLTSLAISALLTFLTGWAGAYLPLERVALAVNEAVSMAFCAALFVALMRMSAGPKPDMRYLVMGGVAGGILFSLGKYLMALYLSTAAVVSAYGAAGSLVVLLMWIYFSSAVLLLSASVARSLSDEAALQAASKAAAAGEASQTASPLPQAAPRRY